MYFVWIGLCVFKQCTLNFLGKWSLHEHIYNWVKTEFFWRKNMMVANNNKVDGCYNGQKWVYLIPL